MTIQKFVRLIRMERAAELLRSGRCNVTEAALEVGYNSLSHFSSVFHETYGCCPGLYPLKTTAAQGAQHRRPAPVSCPAPGRIGSCRLPRHARPPFLSPAQTAAHLSAASMSQNRSSAPQNRCGSLCVGPARWCSRHRARDGQDAQDMRRLRGIRPRAEFGDIARPVPIRVRRAGRCEPAQVERFPVIRQTIHIEITAAQHHTLQFQPCRVGDYFVEARDKVRVIRSTELPSRFMQRRDHESEVAAGERTCGM